MSVHNGHRERMRQEFLSGGLAHFSEPRVLELLLFYSRPRGDVNPLAHQLLEAFGSLAGVLDASPTDLAQVPGMGENTVALLKLIPAIAARYLASRTNADVIISDSASLQALFVPYFFGARNELSFVACFDGKLKLLGVKQLSEGTPTATRSTCERSRPSPSPSTPPPWSWPTTTPAGWPRPPRKIFFSPIMCSSHCSPWALRCTIMSSSRTTTWSPCGTAAT